MTTNKVYIVTDEPHEEDPITIEGVFASKRLARAHAEQLAEDTDDSWRWTKEDEIEFADFTINITEHEVIS